jgi:hypothetical protein
VDVFRPVVERSGIEVCAIWPNQRMDLTIHLDLIEQGQILQGSEKLAAKNGLKVNDLFGFIIKSHV